VFDKKIEQEQINYQDFRGKQEKAIFHQKNKIFKSINIFSVKPRDPKTGVSIILLGENKIAVIKLYKKRSEDPCHMPFKKGTPRVKIDT